MQEAVAARRQQFDRAQVKLNNLRRECNVGGLFPSPWEGLDGFHLEGAHGDGRNSHLRRRISDHFSHLQTVMLECLTLRASRGRSSVLRVYNVWSDCVGQLKILRNTLTDIASGGGQLTHGDDPFDLTTIRSVWGRGANLLRTLTKETRQETRERRVNTDWDGFETARLGWATRLGSPGDMVPVVSGEGVAQEEGPVLQTAPTALPAWPATGGPMDVSARLKRTSQWLQEAVKARGICQRLLGKQGRSSRVDALLRRDFKL